MALAGLLRRAAAGGFTGGGFEWAGLNFELDAGNLRTANAQMIARALAKLGHADVAVATELDSACNDSGIDLHAGCALELEKDIDAPAVGSGTCQHPSAAAENGAGECTHKIRRLQGGDSLNLQRPGHDGGLCGGAFCGTKLHNGLIGPGMSILMPVRELNGA